MSDSAMHYVYVVVRRDIPLADQAVQACHAALEAGFVFNAPSQTASLVLLSIENEQELTTLARTLTGHGIDHALFFEPDDAMGHSALATRPVAGEDRKPFCELSLWRGATA